jgi:hypothetical protein
VFGVRAGKKQTGRSGRNSKNGQRQSSAAWLGRKKTARLAGGFSGILGVLRVLTPLSIRQRSEIPEKVKVKPGERHGEKASLVKKG